MREICAAILAIAAVGSAFTCASSDPYVTPPAEECREQGEACSTTDECCVAFRYDYCKKTACQDGICGFLVANKLKSQSRGDCVKYVCLTDGSYATRPELADLPDDGNPCSLDECKDDGPSFPATPRGRSPDGIGFCDGCFNKIECMTTADCEDPALLCSPGGKCVAPWCVNGAVDIDHGETDLDCGGACDPCPGGSRCNSEADCAEGVCGPRNTCSEARCDDGVKNGEETGVDCGMVGCQVECGDGDGCQFAADCVSSICLAGVCQAPRCGDGMRNGPEQGWDCGGPGCHPCE
ncbi:hypothetical protein BE17_48515 [Sorangium cellulosum]|uniref:Secreted protein n=1 Tax=Sorangium cellulosum TaxID=56 RepID=A0A150R292_SORCE|nr:hypothetical protein BE17_48515 [Sorangium cellulosum]